MSGTHYISSVSQPHVPSQASRYRWMQVGAGGCRWMQVDAGGCRWVRVDAGRCWDGPCGVRVLLLPLWQELKHNCCFLRFL